MKMIKFLDIFEAELVCQYGSSDECEYSNCMILRDFHNFQVGDKIKIIKVTIGFDYGLFIGLEIENNTYTVHIESIRIS